MTTIETRHGVLHDYEQGNYIEGTPLEGRLNWDETEALWTECLELMEKVAEEFENPVIGVSGGIDGLVTAHFCKRVGIDTAMNIRTPSEYPSNQEYLEGMMERWGFDLRFMDRPTMDMAWIAEDPDLRLMPDHEERYRQLNNRQGDGIKTWPAQQDDVDAFITGRRKTHNTSIHYSLMDDKGSYWGVNPILHWKWPHVIAYADRYDIPLSPAYRMHRQSVGEPWFKPPRHNGPNDQIMTREEAWWEAREYCIRYGYTDFWKHIIETFPFGDEQALEWSVQQSREYTDLADGYEMGCDANPNPAVLGDDETVRVRDRSGVGSEIYAALTDTG